MSKGNRKRRKAKMRGSRAQMSLHAVEGSFKAVEKKTRRRAFLEVMDKVVPWERLVALVRPYYSEGAGEKGGRPAVGLERMLRIYFVQQWLNLSDPGVEEEMYESESIRWFVGVDLGSERPPDETTVCRFRHLLEQHGLGERMLREVNAYLAEQGLRVARGTIVDATVLKAPSSTKNRARSRDPEMGSTKKGEQWYFRMKVHVGVDSKTKLVHSVVATAANVADCTVLPALLPGQETRVYGDRAYCGQQEAIRRRAPRARDWTERRCRRAGKVDERERAKNRTKARVRARVEHVFLVMKRIFGFAKVRYKGLAKNAHQVFVQSALVNLYMARKFLLAVVPQVKCA
jgi:IS5 family transposase